MGQPLQALIIENSEEVFSRLVQALRQSGLELTATRVETTEALEAALAETWDVILADDAAPQLPPAEALAMLKAKNLDWPFIILADSEEKVVPLMSAGACDYIQKSNLSRLGPAIGREVKNARLRRASDQLRNQNTLLQAEVNQRFEQLQALRQIDSLIAGNLDLQTTLRAILDHLTRQLNVDAADILLLDANTQTLNFAAGLGFRSSALQYTRLHLGEGYAGRAARERHTIIIQGLSKEQAFLSKAPLLKNEEFMAYLGVPLIARETVKGVLELFHRNPLDPDVEWMAFLEILTGQAAIAIENADLFTSLQRSNLELARANDATIEGWSQTLDMRDREIEGHTRRVTEATLRLARELGIAENQMAHIRRGALLHDIGKMGVPDNILLKPSRLNSGEWAVIRKHPIYAYNLLSLIEFLRPALDIPYCHHEKWNGKGYPRGLEGEQIPLPARIFAVTDVWDALCSDRPYRRAWPEEQARKHIHSLSGVHFDPQVVEAFFSSRGGLSH